MYTNFLQEMPYIECVYYQEFSSRWSCELGQRGAVIVSAT